MHIYFIKFDLLIMLNDSIFVVANYFLDKWNGFDSNPTGQSWSNNINNGYRIKASKNIHIIHLQTLNLNIPCDVMNLANIYYLNFILNEADGINLYDPKGKGKSVVFGGASGSGSWS